MKNKNILLILAIFVALQVSATTHRVNSNGFGAAFTDLQTAIDAALSGDTLHVEASVAEYGIGVLDKELHLFGPGYFLTQNTGLQASPIEARVSEVIFDPGSEGSTINGLTVFSIVTIKTGDVTVRRCWVSETRIHDGGNGAYSNVLLIQSWLNSNVAHSFGAAPTITNLMILNCRMNGVLGLAPSVSGTIANCISTSTADVNEVRNMECFNNIIRAGGFNLNNNNFHHNMTHDAGLPAGNNNQLNVDMATVFVSSGTTDGAYELAVGSPAIGTGVNGDDMGMYGGATPYQLSGIPAIPTVYEYNVPATAIEGATINVTISTRTNN